MTVDFEILGPLEVRHHGRVVDLGGPKRRAVLAALLLQAGKPVSADQLIQALWGEEAPPTATKALQGHVSRLRAAFAAEAGRLVTTPAGYRLDVAPEECDARRFEHLCARARQEHSDGRSAAAAATLAEALELWRGPALADLRYEAFAQAEIAQLDELRWSAIEERLALELELGHHASALPEIERLSAEAPLRERQVELRMRALYGSGRHVEALAAYREFVRRLDDELGLEPGTELRDLHQAMLTHADDLDGQRQGIGPGARTRALPAPMTTLFGRDDDVDALVGLVERTRLLTLTGPGGVGKTALALALAGRIAPRFRDGAHVVELAPVADPAHVPAAVTDALGLDLRAGETAREALMRFVADRRLLLVLDNLEHVVQAGSLVAELLASTPELVVVCTSQAPLLVSAERRYVVQPLPFPLGDLPGDEASVAMLCDRARARDPGFAITPNNARAVATICRRLDGLPLALELTAARMGFLSADEVAAGLDDALALLVGGARDAPDRQKTLRATLDWSHRLLSDDERSAFARFAAFAGGATLHAALEVTQAEVLTLESLAAKHLLTRVGDRLTVLEPIRQYAAERLATLDDEVDVRRRHARYYLRLADDVGARVACAGRQSDLELFRAEAGNLRNAIAFAHGQRDGELALGLASACGPWWRETHQDAEGRERVDEALALAGGTAPAKARARALAARARLWARTSGAFQRRREDLIASLELWREVGDTPQQVDCLIWLAQVDFNLGLREESTARADEALALARGLGDDALINKALAARAAVEPEHPECARRVRAAVPSLVRADEIKYALLLLVDVGYAALADGRFDEAREVLEDAVPLVDGVDSATAAVNVYGSVAIANLLLGHDAAAARGLSRSLEAARAADIDEIDEALCGLAALAARRGELEQAARLAGAGLAHAPATLGPSDRRIDEIVHTTYLAPARQQLGALWDQHAREGARLGHLAAIDLGLATTRRWARELERRRRRR